jgi:hypothetical protein
MNIEMAAGYDIMMGTYVSMKRTSGGVQTLTP